MESAIHITTSKQWTRCTLLWTETRQEWHLRVRKEFPPLRMWWPHLGLLFPLLVPLRRLFPLLMPLCRHLCSAQGTRNRSPGQVSVQARPNPRWCCHSESSIPWNMQNMWCGYCLAVCPSGYSLVGYTVKNRDTIAVKKVAAYACLVNFGGQLQVTAATTYVITSVVEFLKDWVEDSLYLL